MSTGTAEWTDAKEVWEVDHVCAAYLVSDAEPDLLL